MAKFISIQKVGVGIAGGETLLSGDLCSGVSIASATRINYHFNQKEALADITYTGGAAGGVLLRDAINYCLTANPGGVLAKVKMPAGVTVTSVVIA